MNRSIFALLVLCVGCGGGGGGSSPVPTALPIVASATPIIVASATPTAKPSATASPVATASPTASATPATPTPSPSPVPLALHVAAAPAQVFTAQGLVRRSAQDVRRLASTNLGNGQIPTVVGATSPYYGSIFTQLFVWAATVQATPVPEASFNAVPANVVTGPISVASIAQDNGNAFALTYFDWVVAFNINRVGKGNVTATFGDGTTGSIPVYIYDQWYLTCGSVVDVNHPMEWAYTAGVPKGVFGATSDMAVDCTGLSVTFTNGGVQQAAPVADAWGNVASAFTGVTNATTSAGASTVPVASLKPGTIYIAKLADGGYAKIMPLVNDGVPASPNVSGISLHDSPSGSGLFPF